MVLLIDAHKLDVVVRWEAASGAASRRRPRHFVPARHGRINRDAVEGMMEIQRDADGRAAGLAV
jgi:uncharacterized protein (DUF952 family)